MTRQEALDILGLHAGATAAEIKTRVRELSAKYHPDKHAGADETLRELTQEKFNQVRKAGKLLLKDGNSAGPEATGDSDILNAEALELIQLADVQGAIRKLKVSLKSNPNDAMANFLMGQCGMVLQRFDMAADHFRRATYIEEGDSDLFANLAMAEMMRDNHIAARDAIEQAMSLSEVPDADYYEILARAHIGMGNHRASDQVINELSRIAPNHEMVQTRKSSFRVGNTYVDKGQAAGAGCCICALLELIFDCC